MHHVLTLPRVRRRTDREEPETWVPHPVPTSAAVESTPVTTTQPIVRRVDGVGIRSVIELALIFYGCVFASLAGGVLLIWGAISTMGYVDRFEDFMRSIGFRGFEVSSGDVILGLIGVAGALTLLATFLTVLIAGAYNLVGHAGHGLVVRTSGPDAQVASQVASAASIESANAIEDDSVDGGSPHAA
jgi:hypothetical protein